MKRILIASLMLAALALAPAVAAREGDHDAHASVAVDCDANEVQITFTDEDGGHLTYMVQAGGETIVGKTTVDLGTPPGKYTAVIPLLDNGDYVVVFDDERIIDKSFWEEPFTVDCPPPSTPTPTPPPPTNPPTNPPTMPPHKTLPPSDTLDVVAAAPARDGTPFILIGLILTGTAILGWAMTERKRS